MQVILVSLKLKEKCVKSMIYYTCQLSFVTIMPSVKASILSGKKNKKEPIHQSAKEYLPHIIHVNFKSHYLLA